MSTTPILDLEQLPPEPPKPWSSWLTGGLIGLLSRACAGCKPVEPSACLSGVAPTDPTAERRLHKNEMPYRPGGRAQLRPPRTEPEAARIRRRLDSGLIRFAKKKWTEYEKQYSAPVGAHLRSNSRQHRDRR